MTIVTIDEHGATITLDQNELNLLAGILDNGDVDDQTQMTAWTALTGAFQALALASALGDHMHDHERGKVAWEAHERGRRENRSALCRAAANDLDARAGVAR